MQHRILVSMPYLGWVCCWFSPLLREVFLWVLRFFPSHSKPATPNSNSIWNPRTCFNEFSWTPKCSVGKQIYYNCNLVTGTNPQPLAYSDSPDSWRKAYLEASGSILKQAAGLSRVVIENTTLLTLIYASAYKHVHTWLLFSSARVGRLPI